MTEVCAPRPWALQTSLPLSLRLVLRDLNGGVQGFRIFIACIVLGVMAIVGVGSIARSLSDGVGRESRRILGGDLSVALMHRELNPQEQGWLQSQAKITKIATLRAMSRTEDARASALVEIKAVDQGYPNLGEVILDPSSPIQEALSFKNDRFGLVADAALPARLGLKIGDLVKIGDVSFEFRAILESEPDKLSTGIGFGARALMSQAALAATNLLQPGSLVRWVYRLELSAGQATPIQDEEVKGFETQLRQNFPDAGWEIRTRSNVSPQFSRTLDQLSQFLTLVGLTALVVGGVGVANSVRSFINRKKADFGTLKALGATGSYVFYTALLQVLLVATLGILIGVVCGAALPFIANALLGHLLPVPIEPRLYPGQIATGIVYGLLTALSFALPPLGRAHDISVSALFRDAVDPSRAYPRWRYIVLTLIATLSLVGLIVALATEKKLVFYYVLGIAVGFVLLRLVAQLVIALARRLPHPKGAELRLALSNIHRPGSLTPSVIMSLGLGLALLVTLAMIDGNLQIQISKTVPEQAPSFFFIDIPNAQSIKFDQFIKTQAPEAQLDRVPMMRGRLVRLNDVPAEQIRASAEAAWVLEGDRGITFSETLPAGSNLVVGEWWSADYSGPPLVSIEAASAAGLGLKIGDVITVNVLGRNISAKIANLRRVNWRALGINFVFVFSPNTFAGAPYMNLATATFPKGSGSDQEMALLKAAAVEFPSVTSVRVKDALDAVNEVMGQLAYAIRAASSIALIASVLVLAGALAAGREARTYDLVVLKTLGATRWRLIYALVAEYALLGLITSVLGVVAGGFAAKLVLTQLMKLEGFDWLWGSALGATLFALMITIGLGLLATWTILGQKPARYLRSL